MKKKLLTVLLAVVMVFGVFGLTACKGSNADADYNYYAVKYEIEDEVKIEAVTFQAVYKMFTTAGSYIVYVNSGENKADFQKVNKLANDWNVTIYHFNPELSGGFAANNTNAVTTNIIEELDATAAASQLATVQSTLSAISKKAATDWVDNQVIAISGAESTVSADAVKYNGKIAAANSVADGAKSIAAVATKRPSYGAYTEAARDIPYIPEAYHTGNINTMNLFGDARLHMYNDDNGTDALTAEKEDVFVTVANYEMFAHLMNKNEGYFAVFFGGTWCPNTQAIVYHVNELAKAYGIEKVYFFDPRLEDGTKIDAVKNGAIVENSAYLASSLNTRTQDATGAAYNFNFLYGKFLKDYLPTYKSEWNIQNADGTERFISITVDGAATNFTRMCVPNMMMFNGEEAGKADLIALAEAEYTWANTSVEGNPQKEAWEEAVKSVFDQNPYATYVAPVAAPEAAPEAGGSTGGSAAPAPDAGGC